MVTRVTRDYISQFPIQVDAGEGPGGTWPPKVGPKWPPEVAMGSKIGAPVAENTAIRVVFERIFDDFCVQRDCGFDTAYHEFFQRAPETHKAFITVSTVYYELGD